MLTLLIVYLIMSLTEGKVVKLTERSIHVIVLGFSSAIITGEDIREDFNHKIVSSSSSFSKSTSFSSNLVCMRT